MDKYGDEVVPCTRPCTTGDVVLVVSSKHFGFAQRTEDLCMEGGGKDAVPAAAFGRGLCTGEFRSC